MRSCLITGATGAIGPSVVKAFHQAGYRVRVLARQAVHGVDFPDDIEIVTGTLENGPLAAATRDTDVVVHLAARLHEIGLPVEEYDRANVEGARRLLAAAIESDVPRFVFASTIAVYGHGDSTIINESTPPAPDNPYARSKRAAEELVLSALRDRAPIGIVLRLASVYGPRIKGNYRSLVKAVQRGRYIPVGAGNNRRTLIHEFDVGQAFVLAAESAGLSGSMFNVTDGQFHTLAEIVNSIATALGKKRYRFHLPVMSARAAAAVLDIVKPSMHAGALLQKYLEDLAVDGGRFQRSTGFAPRIDLDSGWQATIRGMRDDGSL
jgi:nucleoside-diphosphate-sugar epimerase